MPSKFVLLTWDEGAPPVIGGGPATPPLYPSQGLPGAPGYPSHGLPVPGLPVQLPVYPFDPTNPIAPGGEVPTHPIAIAPGARFVVKWLACSGLILVPDNSLPATPEPK
jgi:hypothetical protein